MGAALAVAPDGWALGSQQMSQNGFTTAVNLLA